MWLQGVRYGTVGVRKGDFRLEITTFRSDTYREDSRKPEVTFGRSISEDLARRDFTVNAMAMKLPDGPFVDPHGGLGDLAAKRLRTPSSPEVSFEDDPLRMLRAARFASQLELVPTPETLAAIAERRARLQIVSRERIRDELSKLLLGRVPAKGLWLAVNTGLAGEFLPELPALALEQDPVHRHKDVLRHTIAVVERATAFDADEPDLTLRMAALLHDIGKPKHPPGRARGGDLPPPRGGRGQDGREAADRAALPGGLHRRRAPAGPAPPALPHLPAGLDRLGGAALRARRRAAAGPAELPGPLRLHHPQRVQGAAAGRLLRRARGADRPPRGRGGAGQHPAPLDGRQVMELLGIPPGPLVGKALSHLLELRLDRGPMSEEEAVAALLDWAREQGLGPPGD